ncbi:MAG: hypothetical protein ACTS1Z_13435 [Parasphingopyxis sp.]|uniref:hypothetical protein n=1 Tax=Parasphingopyxis sp. TaxID=1920299 RepID=UPI003F9F2A89
MVARKGSATLHARAGRFFFVSMLIMASSAAVLTWWEPDPLSLFNAVLTFYLVATSWMAARRRGREWRRYEWAAMPVAFGCALALGVTGILAMQSIDGEIGGFPPQPFFVFAGLALLAALLDLNYLLSAKTNQRQRIGRHLWRMCFAFFLAATALFLGQQYDVFFFMEGSPLLFIPSLATVVFLVFWIVRVRFAKQWLRPITAPAQR